MYRTRGKPNDPWNRAAQIQRKELASLIQVKPMHTEDRRGNQPSEEGIRRRLHYEEFKETYQQRFQKAQERSSNIKTQMMDTVNKWVNDQFQSNDEFDVSMVSPLELRFKKSSQVKQQGSKQPVMKRAPLRTIKTIPIEVPRFTNQAIVKPPATLSKGFSILERLKKIEQVKYTASFNVEEGVQVDFMQELNDTKQEIEIATSQLQQIQNMLNQKRLLALQEEAEEEKRQRKEPERMKTKWSVTKNRSKSSSSGKTRLLTALKTVNSRLQKMQEHYFMGPHPHFKSLKQVTNNLADVDIIYKNKKFQPLNIDSTIVVKKENSKEISPVIKKYILKSLFQNDKYDSGGAVSPKNSSPRRSLLSNRPKSPLKIIEEIEKSSDTLKDSSVDVILPPQTSAKTSQMTARLSHNEGGDSPLNSAILSSCLKESIMKSDFLMKEFGMKKSEFLDGLFKKKTPSKKKTVHFSSQNLMDKEKEKEKNIDEGNRRIQNAVAHALKHTLYTV